jgi:2-haloalkanoic acid dehalogenase type II
VERQYDIITFDCYGTLIDWEQGIRSAFLEAASEDGVRLEAQTVIPAYSEVEPVVERERFRSYRDVLAESAVRAAWSLGWRISVSRGVFLAESLKGWKPFPDTNAALEKLKNAGYRLGILSNVDDDLLEQTRRHFTVPFDVVVTAGQVHSYKPAAPHFLEARKRIGVARWLHAAQSNYHDIVPTNSLGIPNAWINRRKQNALTGGKPTYEFPDLKSFAGALAGS